MREGLVRLHDSLTEANITYVFYESPGTSHEWQTWRRDLIGFRTETLFSQLFDELTCDVMEAVSGVVDEAKNCTVRHSVFCFDVGLSPWRNRFPATNCSGGKYGGNSIPVTPRDLNLINILWLNLDSR
jgi:hypothetical protein